MGQGQLSSFIQMWFECMYVCICFFVMFVDASHIFIYL